MAQTMTNMKHILITTIAAVVLVGCATTQQSPLETQTAESAQTSNPEAKTKDLATFLPGKPDARVTKERIFNKGSEMVILPRWRVQDIDTSEDWDNAEMIFRLINKISFKN